MDGRDSHLQAIAYAHQEAEEVSNLIIVLTDKVENLMGAVIQAVGEDQSNDSGRKAFEQVAKVREELDTLLARVQEAATGLDVYRNVI